MDGTYEEICRLAALDGRVRGAEFSRNFGKEAAIFAGLELSAGDACIVMDCDLQHPPEVIPEMYRLWKDLRWWRVSKRAAGRKAFFTACLPECFTGS